MLPRSYLFRRPKASSKPSKDIDNVRSGRGHRNKQDLKDMPESESTSRPSTPSSPILIPGEHIDNSHESQSDLRKERRYNGRKQSGRSERRAKAIHSPGAIPPSVAALLALTAIPPQKSNSTGKRSRSGQRLTVDAILEHTNVSEKEFSMSLAKSPLDFLLGQADDYAEDEYIGSENGQESILSTRTISSESVPSLDDGSISEVSPFSSPVTPGRGRKSLPIRRILSGASLSQGESVLEDHPLSAGDIDMEELDFRVFQRPEDREEEPNLPAVAIDEPRRKSAFKSNLTASLRALKSAAKSFSTLTTPYLAPDDFLTRSIISIDPKIPFTDERRPRLEDTPTPALRRYLNPTTNAPIEAHVPSSLTQMSTTKCTASIQMQTYKVSRAGKGSSPTVISRRTQPTTEDDFTMTAGPVTRQRDMRENSDFIRIAVMEMAMRKKGKLDDQKPGRARWALPPRQAPTKPYEIGEDGVPVRWIGVTQ